MAGARAQRRVSRLLRAFVRRCGEILSERAQKFRPTTLQIKMIAREYPQREESGSLLAPCIEMEFSDVKIIHAAVSAYAAIERRSGRVNVAAVQSGIGAKYGQRHAAKVIGLQGFLANSR